MNKQFVQTDTLILKKHNLKIYRVTEQNSATVFWTSEQPAIYYVKKRCAQKLFAQKKLNWN